ncbi:MAG: hypothetical protein IPL61_33995 [Myxococcales bacterium]|nr:hypothetical protein [Myxococcales bacterium]
MDDLAISKIMIVGLLASCSAPTKPSPICRSPVSGTMPCDAPGEVAPAEQGAFFEAAQMALLVGEVNGRTMTVATFEPGTPPYEDALAAAISTRYFSSDSIKARVGGYASESPDAKQPDAVLYSLKTVGYSARDRVHVQVDILSPSGTPPRFRREMTTYYCVVVGPGAETRIIPRWSF